MYLPTCLEDLVAQAADGIRPPERLTVAEAAVKYRWVNNPGAYVGPWLHSTAPYMTEVMEVLTSMDHEGAIFVGPAQCGKTEIILNWLTHSVNCDPADMMVIQTTQTAARDFMRRRVDRLHRHTKSVGAKVVKRRDADSVMLKSYTNGMMLSMSWPTISELSGRPIPRLWLTDYDRMPMNIDGEGSPFDLAKKRATTFGRHGMTVAESSPGFTINNPQWMPRTAHEAPPTEGVLALYNRGDRRRWYWRCPHCRNAFEPEFSLLQYPDTKDFVAAGEQAMMMCPHCHCLIPPDRDLENGIPGKYDLNIEGRWIKDGQVWMPDGSIEGTPFRSKLATFWLKGVCAAFADWKTLVTNYLNAEEEFQRTGSQEALKTTVNTDQGQPYRVRGSETERLPETLKTRARDIGNKTVPRGTRFLGGTIDVQKNRFVVQVMGSGPGGDVWIVDRFTVRKSNRLDDDGERYPVNPGAYPEDWNLLIDQVLMKSYPLDDDSGRHMSIKMVACDSGGKAGVTKNAYGFWRLLRDSTGEPDADGKVIPPNLHRRFQLIKGASNKSAPRVQISFPDSERKDRHAGARGDVPVMFINTNLMKDSLNQMLDRTVPGGGMIYFPNWLPDDFYSEMCVEVRGEKGWENPRSLRNESWDLAVYFLSLCLHSEIRIERIDWNDPPGWAEDWDDNDLVFTPATGEYPFAPKSKDAYDLAKLAEALA
ncbi:MAG: phage terminase large subunit family protein [Pyrinomonadaceae bacterium]